MDNIALLTHSLNSGGAERVVSRISKILSPKYNVYIILFNAEVIKYDYDGFILDLDVKETSSYMKKIVNLMRRVRRLRRLKKEYSFKAVISFLEAPNFVNILSRQNEKVIISVRNYISKELNVTKMSKIIRKLITILYNQSDSIVSVSKSIEKDLIDKFNIESGKISVIYNPYNFSEIYKLSQEKMDLSISNFYKDNKVIISMGRLMYQKGYWHLVKAFSMVRKKIPNAKLVIIGEDFDNGRLQKLISDLNLQEDIMLLGYNKNPFPYLANADLYVLTSLFEGFPNALVEGMACGLPIIASDCKSGPREILFEKFDITKKIDKVEKADFGIIVPELSPEEDYKFDSISNTTMILADAITELLIDEEQKLILSDLSKTRSKRFSYEICGDLMTKLIEE